MKNKIKVRSDYDKIMNNPIALLEAIKEHALNYEENRRKERVCKTTRIGFARQETFSSLTSEDLSSSQSLSKRCQVTRKLMLNAVIYFKNKRTTNFLNIFISTIRTNQNMDLYYLD